MRRILQTILLVGVVAVIFAAIPAKAQVFEGVPTITPTPFLGANWKTTWNFQKKGYEVYFYWTPVSNSQGYSIAVSKKAGQMPRKEVRTKEPYYRFLSISPGQWYVNLIVKNKDGSWTQPAFWTVNLADPESEPQSTATPEGLLSVTPSPDPDVLSVRSTIEKILKKSKDASLDDVLNIGTMSSAKCSKACSELSCKTLSCEEATEQLNECNCKNLDSNNNGVPCENKCSPT